MQQMIFNHCSQIPSFKGYWLDRRLVLAVRLIFGVALFAAVLVACIAGSYDGFAVEAIRFIAQVVVALIIAWLLMLYCGNTIWREAEENRDSDHKSVVFARERKDIGLVS